LAFIGKQPGKVGTREIARAFGLKGADRAALRGTLKELTEDGQVARSRKKLHRPGTLPNVVLTDIATRDRDGEFIATPSESDEEAHSAPPKITLHANRRAKPSESAGCGDRALLRVEQTGEADDPVRYT